ncbi:MAG: DUF1761 domain-containing protein [Candidatus Sungbacteria bacterium]|nr:DUF1761 domain-containing protein [Candidatus Sungbacteria bacterium]
MIVSINYLAVLAAAVAGMVVGFLWYGPIFGKLWMRLSGMTGQQLSEAKVKGMTTPYLLAFVGTLVMSYVLAHSLIFASSYLAVSRASAGLMAGFWSWLGFVAPVTLGSVLWEGKSWKLWFLNNGHYLVVLLLMGVILSIWK